jgi:hypothetical protein
MKLRTHLHLVQKLRMSGGVLLLHHYVFMHGYEQPVTLHWSIVCNVYLIHDFHAI